MMALVDARRALGRIRASVAVRLRALADATAGSGWPGPQRSIREAARSIAARGHPVATVIDVGASNGMWSSYLLPYFPAADYLLIEAQPVHEPALQAFCRAHPRAHYVLAAAARHRGTVAFLANEPFGGQASYAPDPAIYRPELTIEVPATTIDHEVAARELAPPYLIKLDTHGFEVPILDGARETLRRTELLVIECYNFRFSAECLLFHELCAHVAGLGFRSIDLVDPLYRPHDEALFSMDLVFAREARPEFAYLGYE